MTFQEYILEEMDYYKEYYSEVDDFETDFEYTLEIDYTTQE